MATSPTVTPTSDASLREMSRGTGVSVSHLSRIFRGERTPSVSVLIRMTGYLGVPMEELAVTFALTRSQNRADRKKHKRKARSRL
jgi:transcriptional regulator with XRE-family HTH domain